LFIVQGFIVPSLAKDRTTSAANPFSSLVKYSAEQIEQVREASDIVDVVGEHVRLRKRGRNYVGLCPFHNEKTPSFNVQEDKGIFKCFGCGKAGDVYSFIMEVEGLSFPEAIQRLAQKANITLEEEGQSEEASERETLFNACRESAAFYYRALRSNLGEQPAQYLKQRGLGAEILKKFGVGYAPEASGLLMNALHKKGFFNPILEKAGIISQTTSGEWYERFRGRIIFPVFSPTGRIIGFGGRVMPSANAKQLAKYVNSPETSIYHKSHVLYGLYQAKDTIRRQEFAILVEGYADVLALYQAGFKNVVAASGTSLTKEQLDLLRRYSTTLTLIFDADQAGKNAAVRGIELAIEAGFDVNTVILPKGEDPDSYIRKNGADAFGELLARKQSFIETKAQWFEEEGVLNDPAKHAAAIRSIVETIAKIPDGIKQELFIRRVAGRFRLSESNLLSALEGIKRSAPHAYKKRVAKQQQEVEANPANTFEQSDAGNVEVTGSEKLILESFLFAPRQTMEMMEAQGFSLLEVHSHQILEVIHYIIEQLQGGDTPKVSELIDHFRENEYIKQLIVEVSIGKEQTSDIWKTNGSEEDTLRKTVVGARQAFSILCRDRLKRERALVVDQINYATAEEQGPLMKRSLELARQIEDMKTLSRQSD